MSSEFVHCPGDRDHRSAYRRAAGADHQLLGKKGRESPTSEGPAAVRGAHAKSFGVVRAEVDILADVPAAYAQGIYAKPGRHGDLIRFSSSSGISVRTPNWARVLLRDQIFDVVGPKLVEDEPDAGTFDLVPKNNPIFIANTAKHYLFIRRSSTTAAYLARGQMGFMNF